VQFELTKLTQSLHKWATKSREVIKKFSTLTGNLSEFQLFDFSKNPKCLQKRKPQSTTDELFLTQLKEKVKLLAKK
jgi:hypothetical protein